MLNCNPKNSLSNFSTAYIAFSGVYDYEIDLKLGETNKNNAGPEPFEINCEKFQLIIRKEAFMQGLRKLLRKKPFWVELPIEKMKDLLFSAYLSLGFSEVQAMRYSVFMAKVLHKNRIYFVSSKSALELVEFHKKNCFALDSILAKDTNSINTEFLAFIEQNLDPEADGLELALFDTNNDCTHEFYAGAFTVQPLVADTGLFIGDIPTEVLDIAGSMRCEVKARLDLIKLYETLGAKNFYDAVFICIILCLHSVPVLKRGYEIVKIWCAAHASVCTGSQLKKSSLNSIKAQIEAIDLAGMPFLSRYKKKLENQFYKNEIELHEAFQLHAEFAFEENFEPTDDEFATEIAEKVESIFFNINYQN